MARKELVGTVVSKGGSVTRIVAVQTRISHKSYKKIFTRTNRYSVHDSSGKTRVGDLVKIQETSPISKTKRWVLLDILEIVST